MRLTLHLRVSIYSKYMLSVAVIYLNNPWSLRTLAMYKLATKPEYHEEIVSFGLHRYISCGELDVSASFILGLNAYYRIP